MAHKGFFNPRNPQKYKGDPTKIVYRSSWEFKFMMHIDLHPSVLQWSSEEFSIPYVSPIDGRIHRYFPDFWVKQKNSKGLVEVLVVEIKPKKQTIAPTPSKKRTRTYVNEVKTWGINSAKWTQAKQFCEDRKWRFVIFNEHDLGIKPR